MKSFTDYLSESPTVDASPDAVKLVSDIASEFKKVFPNGYVNAHIKRGLGDAYISLTIGLIGERADQSNQIIDNDPMLHKFMIDIHANDTYTARLIQGNGFSINPDPGSYLAMGRHKVPYRQSKGDSKRILNAMKRHFGRLKTELGKIGHNLYGGNRIKSKYLN